MAAPAQEHVNTAVTGGSPEGEEATAPASASTAQPQSVHYSTGRLTRAQAAIIDKWRARLRLDRPLPGQPPVGPAARILGFSDRPRASCSDAIAVAVDALLASPPAPLELARYAYAGMRAQQDAAQDGVPGSATPQYLPVSWYMPGDLARAAKDLRRAAYDAALEIHAGIRRTAYQRYPGGTREAAAARALFTVGELARQRLPFIRQIPRGAVGRMAIDRWAGRRPDDVAADAVAYAALVHQHPQRARSDMHRLRT